MIETQITILINRKSDIEQVKEKVIEANIRFPVYLLEYEDHYEIDFASDYEEWELDTVILSVFPDYEFTSSPGKGKKEIRLQISRYQSELSTDGRGRPIENPLNETKYLVKKSKNPTKGVKSVVKVLFHNDEKVYHVNIIPGIEKSPERERKGFLAGKQSLKYKEKRSLENTLNRPIRNSAGEN